MCELLIIQIETLNLHILCIYRPPDTTSVEFQPCLNKINSYLDSIPTAANTLLIGDLNFPHLKWSEVENTVIHNLLSGSTRDQQKQVNALLELTDSFLMTQLVTEPTRGNNVLDLVFTNSEDMLSNLTVDKASKQLSDHNIISGTINQETSHINNLQHNRQTAKLAEFCFWSDKADWAETNNSLNSVPWTMNITDDTSVESDIKYLYNEVYKSCTGNIPKKSLSELNKIPRVNEINE